MLAFVLAQLGLAAWLWCNLPETASVARPFPWPVFAVLFAASETFVVHLYLRRESQGVSLSEISLVLGLFFASPIELALARLVGELPVFLVRQSPLKAMFNLTQHAAAVGLAVIVYAATLGGAPALSVRGWLAAYAAAAAAGGYESLAATAVIAIRSGGLDLRAAAFAVASGPVQAASMGTLGLIAAYALAADARAAWLLLATVAVVFFAYRAHARLTDRHRSLERLYRFSQVVSASPDVDTVLHSVLVQAREMLHAQHAEVVFPAGARRTDGFLRGTTTADGRLEWAPAEQLPPPGLSPDGRDGRALLLARGHRDRFLQRFGLREAVAVPLRGKGGLVGVLVVADRIGDGQAFDDADVQLLETVANHASVALENGRLIEALRRDALHDGLTGLPNRALLQRRIQEAAAALDADGGAGFAVMIMDLDGFKDVNDTLGHQNGDLLLIEVAARLLAALRPGALAARLGGDEFAFLVPGAADAATAAAVAGDVLLALEEPVAIDDTMVEVGGSVGVALAPAHGTDVPTLLKRADVAMYAAKTTGVGVQVYEDRLEPTRPVRLALVGELRQGLANDQLVVVVQPKAMTVTGVVHGVEALVRWRHPTLGLVGPDHFVPLAERSGLIRPLTSFVLRTALMACASWRREGVEMGVAVNLSARGLTHGDLVEEVARTLEGTRVPPHLLTLEITENSIMADPARAIEVLSRLHRVGVRLSLDDFGTGYSSLSYLKALPVHEVKIDRSFVETMLDREDDAQIVRSIIDLGGNLALDVVAEGVEDAATWSRLAELGCDFLQGYHLSPPLAIEEFLDWWRDYERRRGMTATLRAG